MMLYIGTNTLSYKQKTSPQTKSLLVSSSNIAKNKLSYHSSNHYQYHHYTPKKIPKEAYAIHATKLTL